MDGEHFPVLDEMMRPAASRWVPVTKPALLWLIWPLPVSLPVPSRYWVLEP